MKPSAGKQAQVRKTSRPKGYRPTKKARAAGGTTYRAATAPPAPSAPSGGSGGGGGGGGGKRSGAANATIRSLRRQQRQLNRLLSQLDKRSTQQANAAKKPKPYDWLAAQTPEQLQAEAESAIHSTFDPQIQAIKDSFAAQLAQGGQAIQGYAQSANQQLAPLAGQVGGFYQGVEGQQAAGDQALYSELMNAGSQVGGNIATQLAQAGLDPGPGFEAGGLGASAATTTHAIGSAAQTRLLGDQAAAQSYYAGLPAVALAQGQSDLSALTARLGQQQSSALEDLGSQIPGAIQDLLTTLQEREYQKAVTRLGLKSDKQKLQYGVKIQKLKNQAAKHKQTTDTKIKLIEEGGRNARSAASIAAQNQREASREANARWLKTHGGTKTNKHRANILKGGLEIAKQAFGTPVRSGTSRHPKITYPTRQSPQTLWPRLYKYYRANLRNATDHDIWRLTYDTMSRAGYRFASFTPAPGPPA